MVDKKGNFNFADFDLDVASRMIDDKMTKNIVEDIRRQFGPSGPPKHKPLLTGPGGVPISQGRSQVHQVTPQRSQSKDVVLQDSMLKRLQQLEKLN